MITNGFDAARVLPVLLQRKGWRQPLKQGSPALTTANTTCLSGKPFQDHHAACTIDMVYSTQEDAKISTADFNTLLTDMTGSVCMEALGAVFVQPALVDEPRMVFEKAWNSPYVTIANEAKFVGWKIYVSADDIAAQVHAATLMFDADADFNLYLFHDQKAAPLKTLPVFAKANDLTTVYFDELVFRGNDKETKGGTYYLGYFQSDLGEAHALDVTVIDYKNYCGVDVCGITADQLPGQSNFLRSGYGSNANTYGLNLEISTYRDYTNRIVLMAYQFDQLIGDLMARNVIEKAVYALRSNQTERLGKERATGLLADLNLSDPSPVQPFVSGLKSSIKNQVMALRNTFYPKDRITVTAPPGSAWCVPGVNKYSGGTHFS